ncbi:MAG: exodeoxyribonuclease VII small subunit [Pseudomonadota bacterium]
MTKKAANADVKTLSFEDALKELEVIIGKLESGQVALEESIALYERGAALKAHCEKVLTAARERIEKIVIAKSGAVETEAARFE